MNSKKGVDSFVLRRERMMNKLYQLGIQNESVLQAMFRVPRHLFVEDVLSYSAYDNVALPIGVGQTISQPYIVARMTELLMDAVVPPKKVLEIGTGCGYQTSVLVQMGIETLYSVERVQSLHEMAVKNLTTLKLARHVSLSCADGYLGLEKKAPFDGIIVTAAPKNIPTPLVDQLAVGGRLVIPLGEEKEQFLWVIERQEHGFLESCIERVCFVPLVNGKV